MAGVLEETTTRELDKAHIERRVNDWANRVDELYREIENWLPSGWTARRRGAIRMHEELMQKFGVPARDLPVLELLQQNAVKGRIEPRGLWIIGANGRLDLFRDSRHYVIVDSADNFERARWQIAPLSDRRKLKPLTRDSLASVL